MNRKNGYILLHKRIADEDSWIWKEKPFSKGQAWIDLLLLANYKDTEVVLKGQTITLKRGQLIRGTDNLATRWGWSRGKVVRFINQCKTKKMVQVVGTPGGTLITIENYEKYQEVRTPNGTADGTTDGTTDGTGINKGNKDKEEGGFTPPTSTDVFNFFQEHGYVSDPEQFFSWYELNDWKKKNGQPVKDWKSLARSWEQREKSYIEERKGKTPTNVPVKPEPPNYKPYEPGPERKAEPPTEEQKKKMREALS